MGLRTKAFKLLTRFYPIYRHRHIVLKRTSNVMGDNIFMTTMAREIRKRNPKAHISVITGLPDLFVRNPDVQAIYQKPPKHIPGYKIHEISYEPYFPWGKHLLEYLAQDLGIRDAIELKACIYPAESDRAWAAKYLERLSHRKPILVSRVGGSWTNKKNWPKVYWQKVIETLLPHYPVFDVGKDASDHLSICHDNWFDLLGKTTIHQLAALMEHSRLLITVETGTLHLASACDLKAVVIVGGSVPAIATQYPGNECLVNRPPCADCWGSTPCEHDLKCMWHISPETVYQKVMSVLKP